MHRRFAPLRIRLPLTVALLLVICTAGIVVAAYRAVRRSVTVAATERLHGAGQRIADALAQSLRRSQGDAQRLLLDHDVAQWLRGGPPGHSAALLDSIHRANPQNVAAAFVRRDGERLLGGDSTGGAHIPRSPERGVSPFFSQGSQGGYTLAAPLLAGRDTLGYLVVVRAMTGTAASADLLGGLVGPDVSVRIGNADGSLWTDFGRPATVPDTSARAELITTSVPLAGTPWVVRLDQPTRSAIAPATALVVRLSVLAIMVVAFGTALAWFAILRFTAPLDDLATTSDALARGDYSRRISRVTTADEVGRAAIAFNTMADEIASHHQRLESTVRERTDALEQALAELRHAQEEIVRKERLATLGQLAGGVGHELRNPLGVMTNAVYVLEAVLPSPDSMVKEYLGILRNQIALCEKIVADLLDFARTKPPARAAVALHSIASHQIDRLGLLNGIDVDVSFPASLPPVDVDGVQIGQVVFNLLTNAVQAMGENGGTLRLRAFTDGGRRAVLEVSDTGPGIPADVAAHLFEPLFTTKARGLGLGLCVSRTLAENNGGDLSYRTELGAGTTFSLGLPVAQHA